MLGLKKKKVKKVTQAWQFQQNNTILRTNQKKKLLYALNRDLMMSFYAEKESTIFYYYECLEGSYQNQGIFDDWIINFIWTRARAKAHRKLTTNRPRWNKNISVYDWTIHDGPTLLFYTDSCMRCKIIEASSEFDCICTYGTDIWFVCIALKKLFYAQNCTMISLDII